MSTTTSIEWAEKSWNPVLGCSAVSPGCTNCYAATMSRRLEAMGVAAYKGLTNKTHFAGVVRCLPERLIDPRKWRKPARIFVNSMSDLFHTDVPFDFIDQVFATMAFAKRHTYLILTKRPERMQEYLGNVTRTFDVAFQVQEAIPSLNPSGPDVSMTLDDLDIRWPLPNVWLGVSTENQETFDERVPHLLTCPAAVRFVSLEPLLGPIDLSSQFLMQHAKGVRLLSLEQMQRGIVPAAAPYPRIGWVIVGGESGPGARPCDIEWIRGIVKQCKAAGVPCFVKQLGKWIAGSHEFDGWKGVVDRWLVQRDGGKLGVVKRPMLRSDYMPQYYDDRPKTAVAWGLNHAKGGDPSEWPEDLRVREYPQ